MSDATLALAVVTALGSGLVGGVFFGFSTFVMSALGRLSAAQGIAAMQSINVAVITPSFMAALFGTTATSVAVIAVALADLGDSASPYLLAGGLLYLLGTVGVTMAFNVPRNNALSSLEPEDPGAGAYWSDYLRAWTRWNHVRTAAALAAAALEIVAVSVG